MTFKKWQKQFYGELLSRTGLEPNDSFDESQLKQFHKEGMTPEEVVDLQIEKHYLTDLRSEAYETDTYNRFRKQALERYGYAPPARSY